MKGATYRKCMAVTALVLALDVWRVLDFLWWQGRGVEHFGEESSNAVIAGN